MYTIIQTKNWSITPIKIETMLKMTYDEYQVCSVEIFKVFACDHWDHYRKYHE